MIHVLGILGTILVLGAYFLVSSGRMQSASIRYQGMNLVGAGLLAAYQVFLAAWPTVVLNIVWAGIAVAAIMRVRRAPEVTLER